MRVKVLLSLLISCIFFINANKSFSQKIFHKYGFIAETRGVHNFFIKPNGELYGWGANTYGMVGDGSTNDVLSPVQIMPEKKWKYVSGGYSYSIAIDSLGYLYAWGDNTNQYLGTGNNLSTTVPVKLNLNTKFKKVFSGWYHNFAIDESGFLWGWGSNSNGQLGDGTLINRNTPKLIDNTRKWVTISASLNHTLGIDSSGVLYGWGSNGKYQLTDQMARSGTSTITKLSDDIWKDVGSGSAFSIALNSQGKAYSWGSNFPFDRWGSNLGYNTTDSNSKVITLINNDTDWVDVSAGYGFSELLKSDGSIWVTHGPGNGEKYPGYMIPTKIENISEKLVAVSGANTQIFALSENGKVYGWGDNSVGILGIGNRSSIEFPTKFSSKENNWKYVSMGRDVAAGIKNDGTLWIWGNNTSGEIPLITKATNIPILFSSENDWTNVSAMDNRVMAIKSDGSMWGIGNNGNGALGLGSSIAFSNSLVRIGNGNDWKKVMLGWFNTIALKNDGTLWSCGWNGDGRNGQPVSVGSHFEFTKIGIDNDWKNFSIKANHTIALKNDGSIYSFGLNEKGQLGLGDLISRDVPTRIGTENDWTIVDASYQYSMALKANGKAYSWGDNLFAQLSRSYSLQGNLTPGLVTGVPLLKNIELGYRSVNFVANNNFLYVIGSNQAYELGIGQSISGVSSPKLQSNDANWAMLSSNTQSTIGIKNDGTLWGWGENASGQVGGKDGFVSPFMPNIAQINANCPPYNIVDTNYQIKEKRVYGDSLFKVIVNDYNFNNTHDIEIVRDSVINSIFYISGTTFYAKRGVDYKLNKRFDFDIKITDNTGLSLIKTVHVNIVQQKGSWYVDSANGDNVLGNGSLLSPYKTIQKSIDASISGDTILVSKGTYQDNLILTKELTIIALDSQFKTVIKPLLPNSQIVNFTSGSNNSKLRGFTLTGGGNVRGSAIDCNFSNPTIENCIITNSAGEAPIRFYYSAAIINNCVIYKNKGGNVFFYDPIDAAPKVNYSTIAFNSGIGTGSSNTSIIPIFTNCIIYGNKDGSTAGNISVLNSIVQGGYLGNSTNINAYPAFKDTLNNDYHLLNYSPAIGLGAIIPGINKDFEGNSKPLPAGSSPDAGAYENNFGHPAPFINTDSSRNGFVLLNMTQTPVGTVNKINIYKGLTTLPTTKYKDTALVSKFIDSANTVFNKVIYYRLTSVGASNLESGYSNEVRTISFLPPSLNFPVDLSIKADTNVNFQWEKIENATSYKLQYSTDSNFISNVIELTKTDTFNLKKGLVDNTTYFWRIQTQDSVHYSKWSKFKSFQTFVRNPILNSITSVNRVITINWSVDSSRNIKAFKIYRGTEAGPTTKIDSISSSNLKYADSVTNGIKYYYRVTAVNTDNVESSFSNELNGNSFGITLLDSPLDNRIKEVLSPKFKWQAIDFATKYGLHISSDSLFSNNLLDTVSSLTSLAYTKSLSDNTTYYWRVRVGDSKGYGNWSNKSTFQTLITPPVLISILPGNKVDTLKWSIGSSKNIKYFKIYADTVSNPTKLKDSISGSLNTYIDKVNLQLNVKYFYRIVAGNQQNIESDFSNILNVVPVNSLPKAIKLINKTVQNAGEYNFVKLSYSASGSIDTDGKITSINWYVNDSLVNKTDSILNYFFKLGTNSIKLIVIDNDGGKDSSTSVLNLSSLQKVFPAGILGGISAINPNYILTADTSFNNTTGSSVSILDRSGNTIFPIIVQSKIFTTPSISSDTAIFITNGSSLNGYSKSGVSLWPTIPLGGISYVTPTIDSNLSRIYVGVSNKNFFAYDYKTGKNVWSIICDAPINTSAVITGDRRLIFTSQTGTLYGFDISKSDIQTTPKWKMSFGDIITKSPAVDASSNIYVGTNAGRLIKFMLNTDGSVSVKWNVTLGSAIQTSPVIDADSNIYVGTEKGDFYKINRFNGSTIWSYNVGAAIYSTPNISEYGTIYISNMNGLVTAISTDKRVLWKYQDFGPISANSLYINNMLYVASEKGTFTGIYDNPNSVNVNTTISSSGNSISSSVGNFSNPNILNASSTNIATSTNLVTPRKPVWGTFQGDYRRSGSLSLICPSSLSISRDANGILISNTPNYIQWYKDGSEILNATDSIFKPTQAGNYLLKNNQAGCNIVSSNSYYYLVTDIVNLEDNQFIRVTPNPYSSNVYLHFFLKGYNSLNVDVLDFATGRPIANRVKQPSGSNLNLQSLSPGVYIIKVYSSDMKFVHMFKIVKL